MGGAGGTTPGATGDPYESPAPEALAPRVLPSYDQKLYHALCTA